MISNQNISVVIPSIGTRDLTPTIKSLNSSSIKIDEIIVSVPYDIETELFKKFSNIIVHKSKYKGQVAQRIEGFKIAKNKFIVQMDDDIILEKNCLEIMRDFIKKNHKIAVSAHFHDVISKKSIYLNINNQIFSNFFFLSALKYFNNKIKTANNNNLNGDISISGFETYPNFQDHNKPFVSGWIPGGCVMHLKKNLILYNFFPFQGKAYCEDLFHSIALKNNNIKLYYHTKAKAFLEIDNIKSNFKMFIRHLRADFEIRQKLVEQNNLSKSRMFLVYLIKLFSYLFK
ncbi:glycosyltransferase [Flavobacteriaceae bacterium]|nr:glycosyltransferase [Flavobacteriaceae bacterium]